MATGPGRPPALRDDYVRGPALPKARAARRGLALLLSSAARPALIVTTCIYVNVAFILNKPIREEAYM